MWADSGGDTGLADVCPGPVYNEVRRQFAVDDLVKLTHRLVTIKRL